MSIIYLLQKKEVHPIIVQDLSCAVLGRHFSIWILISVDLEQQKSEYWGIFSFLTVMCAEILCDDPGTPANGARMGDSLRAFTSLEFSCNENFQLSGSASRTCQLDRTYTGVQPTCDPGKHIQLFIIILWKDAGEG